MTSLPLQRDKNELATYKGLLSHFSVGIRGVCSFCERCTGFSYKIVRKSYM